jgi:hypothetical protein
MSNAQGEHQETESSEHSSEINVSEVMERLKSLEATNARLLEESKSTKHKYQETKSKYEQAEREKLEKEGNYQALLEAERARIAEIEGEAKSMKQKVLKSNMQSTIAKFANEVYDLEDLLNQPKFSHILKDGIDDTSLTLSEEKAKEYVHEVLKAKPYMRKQNGVANTINTKPDFQQGNAGVKSLNELSSSEIENMIKEKFKNAN